jgi:2-hydroxychromene-2-carboxylate isomerase
MADLDFFFDPVCPWAWITSRWVAEVQELRNYTVSWKFISLKILNQDKMDYASMPAGYKDVHAAGTSCLRVAAKARSAAGNDAVAKVYTALGFSLHNKQERELFVADIEGHIAGLLSEAGLPGEWALSANDESFDRLIAEETAMGLERAGKDVGTPIITFSPGGLKEASFFGPVISTIPRGEDATKLWDAIETIATSSDMAELKRSLRARPNFD